MRPRGGPPLCGEGPPAARGRFLGLLAVWGGGVVCARVCSFHTPLISKGKAVAEKELEWKPRELGSLLPCLPLFLLEGSTFHEEVPIPSFRGSRPGSPGAAYSCGESLGKILACPGLSFHICKMGVNDSSSLIWSR